MLNSPPPFFSREFSSERLSVSFRSCVWFRYLLVAITELSFIVLSFSAPKAPFDLFFFFARKVHGFLGERLLLLVRVLAAVAVDGFTAGEAFEALD